jgi:carboxyl-terminal processing protease
MNGGRAKSREKIEKGKLFYPFLMEKDFDGYRIIKVFENSSAWKKGLRPSIVEKINGVDIDIKNQEDTEYLLEASDSVKLTFNSEGKEQNIRLKKEELFFPFVWGFNINRDTGYIKVIGFLENSNESFKDIMKNFKKNGTNKIIIDLRDLSAGKYEEAAGIGELFINSGDIIYYIKSSKEKYNRTFISNDGSFKNFRVVVIVNSKTAFLGEILALSLKEHVNAVIVGEKTAGQMYVTEIISMPCKKMCNLTVARLVPPSGKDLHNIVPDFYIKMSTVSETFGINYIINTDPVLKRVISFSEN